jgi:hypothetical protein
MTHIVLLGDSIFDNAPYVNAGEDVIHHLKRKIPATWKATLLAIDGSITRDVSKQVQRLPIDTTHHFLSVGGNDALGKINYLYQQAESVAEVMIQFDKLAKIFSNDYSNALNRLLNKQLPTIVCTIYNPNYEQADKNTIASTALTIWNDVIAQSAITNGLPLIELRQIFTDPSDYANPIEPSGIGADKLSDCILEIVQNHDFKQSRTIVYGRHIEKPQF